MKKAPKNWVKIGSLKDAPQIALALAEVVVAWSYTDAILLLLVCALLGLRDYNDIAVVFYSIPTFEGRTRLAKNLLRAGDIMAKRRDETKPILKAVEALRGLSGARNRYIHFSWAMRMDRKEFVQFDYLEARKKQGRRKPVREKDLLDHAKTVIARTDDLFHEARLAFPAIPPPPRAEAPKGAHP